MNLRRTVYGFVSRRQLEGTLALFDFPNPMATSDARMPTATPLQQLFFLNSEFIQSSGRGRWRGGCTPPETSARASQRRMAAVPTQAEARGNRRLGLEYLGAGEDAWPQYAQALLMSNELLFID